MDKKLAVEDIVNRLGACGRFQTFLGIFQHLSKVPCTITMYVMIFSVAVPEWWCNDDNIGNEVHNMTSFPHFSFDYSMANSSKHHASLMSGLERKTGNVSKTFDSFRSCKNQNGSKCTSFVFSSDMKTIVSEWEMVCSMSWIPSAIASIQMGGLFVGNAISGQLADSFGRKVPLYLSLLLQLIGNLIGYFSQGWLVFGVGRAICGLAMGTYLTVQYTLTSEVTLGNWRTIIIGLPTWSLASCVFALISYLQPDWRKLHLIAVIVVIPFLFTWKFVPESFRWYLAHGRTKDAKKVIDIIAKVNKRSLPEEELNTMLNFKVESGRTSAKGDRRKYTFIHLVNTKHYARITCLLAIDWLNLGMLTYGIQFGLQALSGSYYLNMLLFNLIGVVGAVAPVALVNRIGRLRTAILFYAMAGAGCLAVGIIQYVDTAHKGSLTSGFAFLASLGIKLTWPAVQIATQELYPTVIRNIGYGTGNSFARLGAIIAPQLAYLDTRVPGLMYLVCFGVSVLCVLGTMTLSETRGRGLLDRIEVIAPPGDKRKISPV